VREDRVKAMTDDPEPKQMEFIFEVVKESQLTRIYQR
jgi:hypothetical protein